MWQTIEEKQKKMCAITFTCLSQVSVTHWSKQLKFKMTSVLSPSLVSLTFQSKWNNQFIATIFTSDMQNEWIVPTTRKKNKTSNKNSSEKSLQKKKNSDNVPNELRECLTSIEIWCFHLVHVSFLFSFQYMIICEIL